MTEKKTKPKNTQVTTVGIDRVYQGDVLKDVEYIESVIEKDGEIEVSKIIFPLVIVLTQDCDLKQDNRNMVEGKENGEKTDKSNQDKFLISVLVAPIYNMEHVLVGEHLSQLKLIMRKFDSNTEINILEDNRLPRYHYLSFDDSLHTPPSVIDFKHYFSVNLEYLKARKRDKGFLCAATPLFRERISQRFSEYLARIGLPNSSDINDKWLISTAWKMECDDQNTQ